MLYLQIIYPTLRRCPFCFPHPRQDPTVHGMCHGVCNSKNFLLSLSWTEAQKKWDFSHNSKWFVNILAEFPSNSSMVPKDPPFVILIFQTGSHIELWLQDTPALMFVGRGWCDHPYIGKHIKRIHWGNFLAEFEGDDFCKMMIDFSGMGHYVYCSSMNLNVLGDFDFNVFSSMNMQTSFCVSQPTLGYLYPTKRGIPSFDKQLPGHRRDCHNRKDRKEENISSNVGGYIRHVLEVLGSALVWFMNLIAVDYRDMSCDVSASPVVFR